MTVLVEPDLKDSFLALGKYPFMSLVFFKYFCEELKTWLFRCYLEAYGDGVLSDIITMGTITCIPKTGKLRNTLKNWRPLTLLNGTYKFLSSMIAERLKSVLEVIINNDQTGFISNRFIGENTRLLYDTITYTEAEQLPGLLIIVDYAKAFDTVEWKFIDEVLKIFGFGDEFSDWIKLLRNGSHTCQPQTKKNRRFSHAAVPLPYTLVYQLPTRCRTCIYNLPTSHQVAST